MSSTAEYRRGSFSRKHTMPELEALIRETQDQKEEDATARLYLDDLGLSWAGLEGKSVIDIGGAQAQFAKAAARRGIHVTSVDVIPGGKGENGIIPTGVPYIVGDILEGVDLPDECANVVVARATLHAVVKQPADAHTVITEAKRFLRPGGEFRFGAGFVLFNPLSEREWRRWQYIQERVSRNNPIRVEDERWLHLITPVLERDHMEGVGEAPHEVRMDHYKEKELAILQEIEPTITRHPNKRKDPRHDFYYIIKK